MELSGGGWRWMELGARFSNKKVKVWSNTSAKKNIKKIEKD